MNRKSLTEIIYDGILVIIAISFLSINNMLENTSYILLAMLLAMFIFFHINTDIKIPANITYTLPILLVCYILSIFFWTYSQFYTVVSFIILYCMYIWVRNAHIDLVSKKQFDWFYYLMFIIIVYNIILNKLQGNIEIIFDFIGDKNYTGILVYLLFLYSNKNKRKMGVLLGILYALFLSESRSMLLLISLFYFIRIFKNIFKKINKYIRKIRLFSFFLILFIAVLIFSYYWVFIVSSGGVEAYRTSLNDGSNRIRFVSNINSYMLLTKPKQTLIWGYGSDILQFLGVDSDNYLEHTKLLGVRIVQPHNSPLNILLRMGIIPGVIYMYILSKMLDQLNTDENMEYIFPYIINSMFMHSLFSLKWLTFWILILLIPEVASKNKKIRIFWKKRGI